MYDVATVSKKISTHAFSVCKSIIAVTVLKAMDDVHVCILDCIGNLQIERVTLKISVMIIIIHCVRKFTF